MEEARKLASTDFGTDCARSSANSFIPESIRLAHSTALARVLPSKPLPEMLLPATIRLLIGAAVHSPGIAQRFGEYSGLLNVREVRRIGSTP